MYVACFSEYTLPRQGVASRVLRRAAAFNRAQGKVVCWLAAMADFSLTWAQRLPHRVPVVAYVTYPLSRAFRPSGLAADPGKSTSQGKDKGMNASLAPSSIMGLTLPQPNLAYDQDRNYLLDQQQTIYDKLVARQQLALEGNTTARLPNPVPLTAAEITHDLAGWTRPLDGTLRASKPDA